MQTILMFLPFAELVRRSARQGDPFLAQQAVDPPRLHKGQKRILHKPLSTLLPQIGVSVGSLRSGFHQPVVFGLVFHSVTVTVKPMVSQS